MKYESLENYVQQCKPNPDTEEIVSYQSKQIMTKLSDPTHEKYENRTTMMPFEATDKQKKQDEFLSTESKERRTVQVDRKARISNETTKTSTFLFIIRIL